MEILVIGGSGMLGSDVVAELRTRGHTVHAPSSTELDISNPESVAEIALRKGLDWCVNCAAYTAVDKAESEEQAAAELNALAPGYLARACAMAGIKLVHVSTDFVFDGLATSPYTEEDRTNPLGVYGRTKLAGEEAVQAALPMSLIFRTSWLFGPNGKSFPKTMIGAWQAGKSLKVVADQVGCPTYTPDLARTIVDCIEKDIFPGLYHATGPDQMSWHEFALRAIQAYASHHGLTESIEIAPIQTSDWPTPATRPAYSALSNEKLHREGIPPMRPISKALADFAGLVP